MPRKPIKPRQRGAKRAGPPPRVRGLRAQTRAPRPQRSAQIRGGRPPRLPGRTGGR